MPDAALAATERQVMRLIGSSNRIAQFYVHPFTVGGIGRGAEAETHPGAGTSPSTPSGRRGLDALIITGANISNPTSRRNRSGGRSPRWSNGRNEQVTTTLFACLAAHATMLMKCGVHRRRLPDKAWGVFPHRVVDRRHPLVPTSTRASTCRTRAGTRSPASSSMTPGWSRWSGAPRSAASGGQPRRLPAGVLQGHPGTTSTAC